jgi:hypothetical protein
LAKAKLWQDLPIVYYLDEKALKVSFHSQNLAQALEQAQPLAEKIIDLNHGDYKHAARQTAMLTVLLFGNWSAVEELIKLIGIPVEQLKSRFQAEVTKSFNTETIDILQPIIEGKSTEPIVKAKPEEPTVQGKPAKHVIMQHDPDSAKSKVNAFKNITPDYMALASLMASRNLKPPLSIGLFGNWGSGKSFFMDKLHGAVANLAASATEVDEENSEKKVEREGAKYYPNIVQIEFNSWHYSTADLWASLVVHIFNNLRMDKGEPDALLKKRRAKLLKVITQGSKLEKDVQDSVKKLKTYHTNKQQELENFKLQREQQQQVVELKQFVSSLVAQPWSDLLDADDKKTLEKIKTQEHDTIIKEYANLQTEVKTIQNSFKGLKSLQKVWRKFGVVNSLFILVLALGFVKGVDYIFTNHQSQISRVTADLVAILAIITTWLKTFGSKLSKGLGFAKKVQEMVEQAMEQAQPEANEAEQYLALSIKDLDEKITEAEMEASQLAEQLQSAEKELQEVNQELSLSHFIEQRSESKIYKDRLGLLAHIREDFERLSKRMADVRDAKVKLPLDDPSRIDRIILYIDDLDRCPPQRVYDVLQAIHLLLAFDLFVVVVGVDERWLTRSLAMARYGQLTQGDKGLQSYMEAGGIADKTIATPADFLEKVFQIPFWLQEMSTVGFKQLIDNMVEKDQPTPEATPPAEPEATPAEPEATPPAEPGSIPSTESAIEDESITEPKVDSTTPKIVELTQKGERDKLAIILAKIVEIKKHEINPESLVISETEQKAMHDLAPMLLHSPRTAKRFVNLYRIFKAREMLANLEHPGTKQELLGGMLLLALVVGHNKFSTKLLEHIGNCPSENTLVKLFITNKLMFPDNKKGNQSIGTDLEQISFKTIEGVIANYLGELTMGQLIDKLATVRRFSFHSNVAIG